MIGLVVKDFLILRKTLRTYLLIIAFYAAIAFSGIWSADIICVMMILVVTMLPMNVFAYDKQCKWDTYGLALPVGRTKTVAARYLCVLLLCLGSVVLTVAAAAALYAAGRLEDPAESMVTYSVMGLMAILVNAILLPFLYKFGPDKARVMFLGIFGAIFGAGYLLLFPLGAFQQLKYWEPTPGQMAAAPFLAALAGLVLLALSFLLSRHFYGKKDV